MLKTVATFIQKHGLKLATWWHFYFDCCDCWLKVVDRWDKRVNGVLCAEEKWF